ncbi:Ig-like domain (group 2) [Fontimonas thermophila]|uniref:Ig-like domain (Group 2) n=1 Tax=Fontimonas thermophila TaxID=1076937 RepID=A0A1I2H2N3_9GAMM|nr:Ig-like domain-containing protein [Fontimonas thermophila]SFF22961.1 Ig-like domain (group 2) [Fontimonas thermophila]
MTVMRCAWGAIGLLCASLALLAGCGGGAPRSPDTDRALQRLELSPDQAQIERGQTQAYTLTAVLANGTRERVDASAVVWTSSVPSVARIDAQGIATALAAGQTEIRARYRQREAVAFLTVVPPPLTALEIHPATAEVPVGLTQAFVARATYADGTQEDLRRGVTWSSSEPARATIDDAGLATGIQEGVVQITASASGRQATATLTVTPPVLQAVIVTPSPLRLVVGAQAALAATAQYSDGTQTDRTAQAVWTSADPAIATVTAGQVSGHAVGTTQITATLDGIAGHAQVEVGPLPPLPFEVGAAERPASFLPLPGSVCLGGYDVFCERKAFAEHDPLVVGAVAISSAADGNTVILVKTTNVGYFAAYKAGNGPNGIYDIRQRIAQRLHARYGRAVVPADQIIVTSDHSHQGPDTIGIWGGVSPLYMAILAEAAVQAGVEAYVQRVPARLYVGSVQGPPTAGSYAGPPTDDPDREFRVLFAEDRGGRRIATLMNYAPHATVLSSANTTATGDWTAWAAEIAQRTSGGVGLGLVGALGAMDWNKSGDNVAREAEARQRLRSLLDAAFAARSEVAGDTVAVKTVFVREPLAQPILLANYAPRVDVPGAGGSLSIERADTPPWVTGQVIGTYASAIRIGDVFIGTMPGEPFPQLHYALRDCATLPQGIEADTDCGGITGARANFLLGAANDFLGYMLYTPEQYAQTFREGAFYLGGCPEEALLEGLGQDVDGACPDHWTLMVSPTIGRHLVCTLQNAAADLGFGIANQHPECALLTAFDGLAAPAEYPATDLVAPSPAEFLASPAAGVVARCRAQGAPEALCAGLETVSRAVGEQLAALAGAPPPPVPAGPSRAGVAVRDASWHLGASAGQFSATGAGIARNAGFDPYGHSVKKVGADILGTRITTRALVIEDGDGRRVGIVANDLYLPNDLLQRRVAQLLEEHDALVASGAKSGPLTRLTGANLAMTASHSLPRRFTRRRGGAPGSSRT